MFQPKEGGSRSRRIRSIPKHAKSWLEKEIRADFFTEPGTNYI